MGISWYSPPCNTVSSNLMTSLMRSRMSYFDYKSQFSLNINGNVMMNTILDIDPNTSELGCDRLNGTTKIGPVYAKSVVYI